jgi:hypothetical protein
MLARQDIEKTAAIKKLWGGAKMDIPQKSMPLLTALGNPIHFILTPGQRNDITQSEALAEKIPHATVLLIRAMIARALLIASKQKHALPSFPRKEIVKYSAYMMSITTKNATLSNASSARSSIFDVSSQGLIRPLALSLHFHLFSEQSFGFANFVHTS